MKRWKNVRRLSRTALYTQSHSKPISAWRAEMIGASLPSISKAMRCCEMSTRWVLACNQSRALRRAALLWLIDVDISTYFACKGVSLELDVGTELCVVHPGTALAKRFRFSFQHCLTSLCILTPSLESLFSAVYVIINCTGT